MQTKPFTYLLRFKPTGQLYYGSRYSNGCCPEQLWTTYYTSSKVIKQLISKHGKDSFDYKITRIFQNKKEARNWEFRFLSKVNAKRSNLWLNQHNGNGDFMNKGGRPLSKEHREKISKSQIGKPRPATSKGLIGNQNNKGKLFSEDSKAKISLSRIGNQNRKGKLHSDEIKSIISQRTSAALKGVKKNIVKCPHCTKEGGEGNMKRYHFDNCKFILELRLQ